MKIPGMFSTKKKYQIEQPEESIGYSEEVVDCVMKMGNDRFASEDKLHKHKLMDICEGYSEEDVEIACKVFARRFPDVMYAALRDEHKNMVAMVEGVNQLNITYMEKTCSL